MFDAAVDGRLKAMYIFGEDVAQTDPDTAHVVRPRSKSLEFLVCQDIFENETTKYADVILPASSFLEKTGTFTNAERRIQLVGAGDRPARRAPRPTSTSSRLVSSALGHEMGLETPERRDGRDRRADAGLRRRHATSGSAATGLQWPVAADGTDSPILYAARRSRGRDGRARFAALPVQGAGRRGQRASSR